MSLFVHVRRDDGQGDDPAGGRVPGAVHSRPVRDLALQEESYARQFLFFIKCHSLTRTKKKGGEIILSRAFLKIVF